MTKPLRAKAQATAEPRTFLVPAEKQPRAKGRSKKADAQPVKMEMAYSSIDPSSSLQNAPLPSKTSPTIAQTNPHPQYAQIQFVHVPYAVSQQSAGQPTPVTTQSQPQTHPQPHVSTQYPSLESVFQDTLNKLRDLETGLSTCQTTTKRALLRHQQEQRKWQMHCMTFKQERDAARRQVMILMQQRSQWMAQHQSSVQTTTTAPVASPPQTESIAIDQEPQPRPRPQPEPQPTPAPASSEHRKTEREARKHSPYPVVAGPSRRFSSPAVLESFSPTDQSSSTLLSSNRVSRALSSPPSFSCQSTSSSPPSTVSGVSTSTSAPNTHQRAASLSPPSSPPFLMSPPSSPLSACPSTQHVDLGDLTFAAFDLFRKKDDPTAFEVSYGGPEPILYELKNARPQVVRLRNAKSSMVARCPPPLEEEHGADEAESDMDLGSDDEDVVVGVEKEVEGQQRMDEEEGQVVDTVTPMVMDEDTPPEVDIRHIDLLYTPAVGRLWCRTCMLEHSKSDRDEPATLSERASFETDVDWEELRYHATKTHPVECDRLARLGSEQLSRLRSFHVL